MDFPERRGLHWQRRLFHITAGSAIPLLGIFLDKGVMVSVLAGLAGLAVLVELLRFLIPALNRLLVRWLSPLIRQEEGRSVTGATYLVIAALAAFLFFEKPVAVVALLFLSLGDPLAALVGGRTGGPRAFGKSLWGTLAFLVASLAAAGALSAGGVVEPRWPLLLGALVAALVELLPLPLNDNLTIPLFSGGAMSLLGLGG
jgi:glycerol-3-phosphate acyltransferase PlsY